MQLRRALLLFAVVLGLAALAASLSRPREDTRDGTPAAGAESGAPAEGARQTPADGARAPVATAKPPAEGTKLVSFDASRPRARRVEAGRALTVTVAVEAPGTVEIASLGLSAAADSLTPARFELLEREPGRHTIRFAPADGGQGDDAGTIVVRPASG